MMNEVATSCVYDVRVGQMRSVYYPSSVVFVLTFSGLYDVGRMVCVYVSKPHSQNRTHIGSSADRSYHLYRV